MKAVISSIVVAIILALILSLPVLAQESGIITITMIGANDISISLDKTAWPLGNVTLNTEYYTSPPMQWCTLTVEGNCNVNTFIVGEDAEWIDYPNDYKWTLSNSGGNGEDIYGLWFRISGDTTRGPLGDGYVPITKTQSEFWPYPGCSGTSLAPEDYKQFGLKLLTPTYFWGGRQMQAHITISAVIA
jgi:hypothetical protein